LSQELTIFAGITLQQLKDLKQVEFNLTSQRFSHMQEMALLDRQLKEALRAELIEIEVRDDFERGVKTLIVYPFGQAPEEFDEAGKRLRFILRKDPLWTTPTKFAGRPSGSGPTQRLAGGS